MVRPAGRDRDPELTANRRGRSVSELSDALDPGIARDPKLLARHRCVRHHGRTARPRSGKIHDDLRVRHAGPTGHAGRLRSFARPSTHGVRQVCRSWFGPRCRWEQCDERVFRRHGQEDASAHRRYAGDRRSHFPLTGPIDIRCVSCLGRMFLAKVINCRSIAVRSPARNPRNP